MVVLSEKVANLKYSELKDLIAKSLGLPGALKALLRASGAKIAFIYGTYAFKKILSEKRITLIGRP